MGTQTDPQDDDMPGEIDFSNGMRGKFFSPSAEVHLPVYLEAGIQTYLAARARAKGIDMAQLVNDLLRKYIELIETAK